jgi:uncharacterized protein YndB with AHSA1/START domain
MTSIMASVVRDMALTHFHLTTQWTLAAAPMAVWDALARPQAWPSWWRAVERVEVIEPGDPDGTGAYRRLTWRTALPYRITFNMRTVRVEKPTLIEGRADGELAGTGRWTLAPTGAGGTCCGTHVRYDWMVEVTKPWMRLIAPLARPLFAWNHNVVMEWGRQGLERLLAAEITSVAGSPGPDRKAARES